MNFDIDRLSTMKPEEFLEVARALGFTNRTLHSIYYDGGTKKYQAKNWRDLRYYIKINKIDVDRALECARDMGYNQLKALSNLTGVDIAHFNYLNLSDTEHGIEYADDDYYYVMNEGQLIDVDCI